MKLDNRKKLCEDHNKLSNQFIDTIFFFYNKIRLN